MSKNSTQRPAPKGPGIQVWTGRLARSQAWFGILLDFGPLIFAGLIPLCLLHQFENLPEWTKYTNMVPATVPYLVLPIAALTVGVLGVLRTRDEKARAGSNSQAFDEGFFAAQYLWSLQASLEAGATHYLYRQYAHKFGQPVIDRNTGEEAIRAALNAIAAGVAEYFKMRPNDLKVNLMVPLQDSDGNLSLKLVAFAREDYSRYSGREIPLSKTKPTSGAPTAFVRGISTYIPDIRSNRDFDPSRPYRTIMSWPVRGSNREDVLGVVNVDSDRPAEFGGRKKSGVQSRDSVEALHGTMLGAIALALLDEECYSFDGQRLR